jgi:hypothetical protein
MDQASEMNGDSEMAWPRRRHERLVRKDVISMRRRDSYFLDAAAAERAVQLVLPMIEPALASRVAGASGFLYIVVMQPGASPPAVDFEQAILYEHAVGDRSRWDADYAGFARAKARLAWNTGMDSHTVQELRPHLLSAGDTTLWGSVVVDGIVVGVSGADPWFDEAFAGAIAMTLRALAKAGIAAKRGKQLFLDES